MLLDSNLLAHATGSNVARAAEFAPHLAAACAAYGINTVNRLAGFLGQLAVESGSLRYVEELASGTAYEWRTDLGNVMQGDGPRYKGHGLIQCTGRSNHAAARDNLRDKLGDHVPDFEADPIAMTTPEWASWSAAEWWHRNDGNRWADLEDWRALGRLVNRGDAHAAKPANNEAERLAATARALRVVGDAAAEAPAPEPEPTPTSPEPDRGMPSGEAPDYVPPPPKDTHMGPFVIPAALELAKLIPKLLPMFSTSEVAQRNAKAAEVVLNAVVPAVGAANAQDAIERIKADPGAAQAAVKAVESVWFQITEVGGGVAEARKADQAYLGSDRPFWHSPAFWVTILLLPLVYGAGWAVLFTDKFTNDLKAMVVGAIFGGLLTGAITSFWFGTSAGSQKKTDLIATR